MMSQETCMALSAVFPLILVTIVIEHPRVLRHVERNGPKLNSLIAWGMGTSLTGLVACIIGVQLKGLPLFIAALVWLWFGVSIVILAIVLMAIVQFEHEEHEENLKREREAAEVAEAAAIDARRRSRVWWRRLLRTR